MTHGAHRRVHPLRNFSIVWVGQTISLLGDYIAYFTVPYFLTTLSERAFDFGLLAAAENIPTLVFGFLGGTLLDRYRLRPFLVVNELLRAGAFLVLAVAARTNDITPLALFAFAFVAGSLAASFNASLQAFVPSLVSGRRLPSANSQLSLSQQAAFLIGPLIGALIVSKAGFSVAFIVDALTFVVSAISFLFLIRIAPRKLEGNGRFFADMKEGWHHLWTEPRIKLTTLGGSLANFITGFIEATLVLIGIELLGTSDAPQLSVFYVAMGAGGIIGSLTASKLIDFIGIGRSYVLGFAMFGLGVFGLTWPSNLAAVAGILAVGFAGLVWTNVSLLTMRQLYTPAHLLGRVSAAGRALAWSTAPFGALFGTALADKIGLLTIVRIGPIVIVLFAVYLIFTVVWTADTSGEGAPESADSS